MRFFFAQFVEHIREIYRATFDSSGGGKSNQYIERLGYFPLFASVAETQILTNPQVNATALQQVLDAKFSDVFSIVENKSAEAKSLQK